MTRKECIDGMQRVIDEDRNKILVRVHVGYLIHAVKYLKDQQEIVRCKDCAFHDSGENEVDAWNRCRLHKINTSDDEYCSWGVMRE